MRSKQVRNIGMLLSRAPLTCICSAVCATFSQPPRLAQSKSFFQFTRMSSARHISCFDAYPSHALRLHVPLYRIARSVSPASTAQTARFSMWRKPSQRPSSEMEDAAKRQKLMYVYILACCQQRGLALVVSAIRTWLHVCVVGNSYELLKVLGRWREDAGF